MYSYFFPYLIWLCLTYWHSDQTNLESILLVLKKKLKIEEFAHLEVNFPHLQSFLLRLSVRKEFSLKKYNIKNLSPKY
jgi:hypothetical protein